MTLTRTTPVAAVMDIGSNAARMIIGRMDGGVFTRLLFTRVPVSLGSSAYRGTKTIAAPAQKRLVLALSGLQQIAQAMEARQCKAVATAAVRDCKNRRALLSKVLRETGLQIEVLTGDEEAEIVGAFIARQFPSFPSVLNADTGGGSTDCAIMQNGEVIARATFAVGTTRANGGVQSEKKKMAKWLAEHCNKNTLAAASGGSARKMEAVCGRITEAALNKFLVRAEKMTVLRRAREFDLTPDRARNIVPAARIGKLILQASGVKTLHTISGGLGEAVLSQMLVQMK